MKVRSGVLLLFCAFNIFVSCNIRSTEDTRTEQVLMPLVYLRNINYDNITLQVPIMYVPIVILSISLDQKQESLDTESKEETFETKDTMKSQIDSIIKNNETQSDDIEVNFRQSLNRGAKVPKKAETKSKDTLNQNSDNSDNNTDSSANTTNDVNVTSFESESNVVEIQDANETQVNSNNSDMYNASNYDNKSIDSLSLTTINEETKLPAIEDKRWKNFVSNANNSVNKTSTSNNLTPPNRAANSNKSPYSDASYNNAMIDQLSITTNSYTNLESSTAESDRWTFPSLGGAALKPTGFKPLAGLYYDGFLHTPLIKMPGFNPHGDYYNP